MTELSRLEYAKIFVQRQHSILLLIICVQLYLLDIPISPDDICTLMCPTFTNVYSCSHLSQFPNVPLFLQMYIFPNVPHFYKCIFVPSCLPLLQMYICALMCPTSQMCYNFNYCAFVPKCAALPKCPSILQFYRWSSL